MPLFCRYTPNRFTRRLPLLNLTEDGDLVTAVDISDGIITVYSGPTKDCVAVCDRLPKLVEGEWYHLTIAHHKSRNKAMQAVVYLNGHPAQTVRLPYPKSTSGLHKVQCSMGQSRNGGGQAGAGGQGNAVRIKWTLGATYLLSEPIGDIQALMLYALGPNSALSFVGEDGQGSFPLCYDLCSAVQLRQLVQAIKHNAKNSSRPHVGVQRERGAEGGGAPIMKGQFTDLSAVPVENTGVTADQVVLSLAPREASDEPTSLESLCAYSALCTQETMSVELSGGAIAVTRQRMADAVRYTCQFPLAPAMMLCERATTVEELQLSLDFLLAITHAQPWNLQQMEKGHFYAILSQLLRRKSKQGLIVVETVEPLLAMVGRVRLTQEDGSQEYHVMPVNIQAFQHLVLVSPSLIDQ